MLYFPLDPTLKLKRRESNYQNKENFVSATKSSATKRPKPNNEK